MCSRISWPLQEHGAWPRSLTLLLVVIVLYGSTAGQSLVFPMLESRVPTDFKGPTSVITYDACRALCWATGSGGLWKSSDYGLHWDQVPIPGVTSPWSIGSVWMNDCMVMCQWSTPSLGNRHHVAVLQDSGWTVLSMPTGPMYAITPMAIGAGRFLIRMDYRRVLHYSNDGGLLWDTMALPAPQDARSSETLQRVSPSRIALIGIGPGAIEYGAGLSRPMERGLPEGARVYRYASPDVLYASGETPAGSSWIASSNDSGSSWMKWDSLVIAQADSVRHGSSKGLLVRWMEMVGDSTLVCVVHDGTVLQCTVGTNTWTSPGRVPGLASERDELIVASPYEHTVVFKTAAGFFWLTADGLVGGTLAANVPSVIGLVVAGDTLASVGPWGSYRSVDRGKTWVLSLFVDAMQGPDAITSGLRVGTPERLAFIGDSLFVALTAHGVVAHVSESGTMFSYRTRADDPFDCDNGWSTSFGPNLSTFDGRRSYIRNSPPAWYPSSRPLLQTPIDDAGVTWFGRLGDSTIVAVGDTMQMSGDEGATWRVGGNGLPKHNGRSVAISALLRTRAGSWVAGARGWTFVAGDSTVLMPGGLYRSIDEGRSWSPTEVRVEDASFIWDIEETTTGALIATAAYVSSTEDVSTLVVSDAYVMRSTDDGRSWTNALVLPGRQRRALSLGYQVDCDDRGFVAVIDEATVWVSKDEGVTWRRLDVPSTVSSCLLDVALAPTNDVWVAANDALHRVPMGATGADESSDPLRYTSIWVYPTPVHDRSANVRINNLDLHRPTLCRISVVDLQGVVVQDLTASIVVDPSQQRQEFSIPTADLSNGLYFVVLDAGSYRTVSRMLISR